MPRVQWVDAAKGLCILLVVLGHAITELTNHGWTSARWAEVNLMLGPVRMPLFFLVSGLFAAKALSESWPQLANRRIWVMVWLYVIWVPARELVLALIPRTVVGEGIIAPPAALDPASWPAIGARIVHSVYEPTSYLWFLYALALFAILSKAMRRIHPVIQVGLAAAVSVWAPFQEASWSWDFISQMYVFYLLGMYGAPWIFRLARARLLPVVLVTGLVYVAVAGHIYVTYPHFNMGNQGLTRLLLSLTGVTCAVTFVSMFEGTRVLLPFHALGRRTLPVFLMHIPVLVLIMFGLNMVFDADPVVPLQTVLVTVAAAVACLGIHRLLLAAGAGWMFARPAWAREMTRERDREPVITLRG
ncbi:acyltransferase family protein [Corynebacterium sp. 335C]